MDSEHVPQQHASEEFEVELESSNEGTLRAATRWAAGLVDAFFGGDGSEVVGAAVVVHRLDDHSEVIRINTGTIEEAESLVFDGLFKGSRGTQPRRLPVTVGAQRTTRRTFLLIPPPCPGTTKTKRETESHRG